MKRSPLRRDTPKACAWANTRKPIARKERLRPFGKRAKRDRATGRVFGPLAAFVRRLNCDACGTPGPSDPHHVRSRGAGFGDWIDGAGNLVALCRPCHRHAEDNPKWLAREFTARAREHGEAFVEITE